MPWFRVDDSFASHPKVRSIPRKQRMAAIGVWTACGLWSTKHLTDGLIPRDVVEDEGGRQADATNLVTAGLWHRAGHGCERCPQPPSGGYQFHDWSDYQPTKDKVMSERAATADRVRRHRQGRSTEGNAVGNAVTPPVSNGAPGPARPGPAQTPSLLTLVSRLAAGDAREQTPPPAEQISAWQDLAGPDVDLIVEAREYLMRHGDRPARDERGAWLGWLRRARARADEAAATAARGVRPTPIAPPCPLHPGQPATRCSACDAEATPAPDLRALRAVRT